MKSGMLMCGILSILAGTAVAQVGTGETWDDFGPDRASGAFLNITRRHLTDQHGQGIAVDPQRRILVLNEWDESTDTDTDCAVTRHLNRARVLDMDYTGPEELEGTRHIAMNLGGTNVDTCSAIASDRLNRAVVVGGGDYGGHASGFVVRLAANGDFDTTFSSDGKFALKNTAAFAGITTRLNHVQIQPDNRILSCGYALRGSDRNMIVVRFTTAGLLDSSFNGNGIVEVDFNGASEDDASCARLALLADGDMMLAGTALDALGAKAFAFARLNANGSFDSSFSGDGRLRVGTGAQTTLASTLDDIAYDPPRDRFVAACNVTFSVTSIPRAGCVLAILSNGVLDASFGNGGRKILRFSDYGGSNPRELGGTRIRRLLLRDDGAIYLLGTHYNGVADAAIHGDSDVATLRLKANGGVTSLENGPDTYADGGIAFHTMGEVRHKNHGAASDYAADQLASEVLIDATWYQGNLILLADRPRYRDTVFDHDNDGVFDEPGPVAPVVASITGEHLFGADFDFDGLDIPSSGLAPVIAIPFGYGNYCSVINPAQPSDYGLLAQGSGSDPCQQFLDGNPNVLVKRAGLYSLFGTNAVIGSCSGGSYVSLRIGTGSTPFDLAFADTAGQANCVFTAAPASMPIFSRPYTGTNTGVGNTQSFNHDPYNIPLDVGEFGQPSGTYDACYIDNRGRQRSFGDPHANPSECVADNSGVDEAAADIDIDSTRTTVAMAAGRVVMAVPRHIPMFSKPGNDPYQREVFVRHQVGSGRYAEIFTSYYAHMQDTRVRRGDAVAVGSALGQVGETGAAYGQHLHLSVHRNRNLSYRAAFEFDFSGGGRFDRDSWISSIDPWGWQAPMGADPWAWRFRNPVPGNALLDNAGSFSTRLWISGQAPPLD
jgi:uncharacterized delta-60 repeat protein